MISPIIDNLGTVNPNTDTVITEHPEIIGTSCVSLKLTGNACREGVAIASISDVVLVVDFNSLLDASRTKLTAKTDTFK